MAFNGQQVILIYGLKTHLKIVKNFRNTLKEEANGDLESIETTQLIPGRTVLFFPSGFELDIMTSLKGFSAARFYECYKLSPTALIEEIPVKFLHLNQLIEAKKAAGRPKDLLGLIEPEKIRDRK